MFVKVSIADPDNDVKNKSSSGNLQLVVWSVKRTWRCFVARDPSPTDGRIPKSGFTSFIE